ncbi:hypothetical protein tb265_05790 [Gemmatimonadetes bacterium T265]|nr:hypothetical protein tb265_05790 [Gemmatimonadetes bacterium T265]
MIPAPTPPRPPAAVAAATNAAAQQPAAAPFDLARYRDRKRVLILFAPTAADTALAAEDAALRERAAGVAERDLVVVRALESGASTADGQPLGTADAAELRRRLRAEPGRFTAVLVGKDGHVAVRSHAPVVAGRLFPTIDAMPMRRAEMARRRAGAGP